MPRVGSLGEHTSQKTTTIDVTVAERAILRLEPSAGRVLTHLVMPGIDRTVDITTSPAAAVCALEDAAARTGVQLSRVRADTRRNLTAAAASADASEPPANAPLLGAFGGVAFPLLAAAHHAGATAIGAVPSWAATILGAISPRDAAPVAFGDRATRPVTAALAQSLIRGGTDPVDLSRLVLALMGRDELQPDQIATVLTAPGPAWPTSGLPTSDEVSRAREAARYWGARRTFEFLIQAAADDTGRTVFSDCVIHAVDLGPHAPLNLPNRLAELRDVYRLQVRTAPDPAARPVRRTMPAADRVACPTGEQPVTYGALIAPRTGDDHPVAATAQIPAPSWLAAIDGTSTTDGLGFVLPHRGTDLTRWGRAMANCLDTYRRAAVDGSSHLVGITQSGRLRYVLEISPRRRIRQFAGHANRPVPRADHDHVVDHLRALRVLV